jgi:hypothetical protein
MFHSGLPRFQNNPIVPPPALKLREIAHPPFEYAVVDEA